jgi:hypothetical protein
MRMAVLATTLFVMMLTSTATHAQTIPSSRPPAVTETPDWQLLGEPIFYAGDVYDPTGPDVFFDANVMVHTGVYRGVPLYTDTTLQPFSVIHVPVGRNLMRPYEKRRTGELAGTTGSRTPSFPGEPDAQKRIIESSLGVATSSGVVESVVVPEPGTLGTSGVTALERPVSFSPTGSSPTDLSTRAARVESVPRPRSNGGVWIEYEGRRWYAAGAAESFVPDRFTRIGTSRGFPIYRAKSGDRESIYVPAVAGGPVTRYRQR